MSRNAKPRASAASGFVLPVAIFILVILAALAAWLMRITVNAASEDALEMQGERAYLAAQAGLEAGIYAATHGIGCTPIVPSDVTVNLSGDFKPKVYCTGTTANEAGNTITFYTITSVACNQNAPGTGTCYNDPKTPSSEVPTLADYAERQLTAKVQQ